MCYKSTVIKKILFPYDFWAPFKKDEVCNIIEMAKIHRSGIIVLQVKDEYDLTEVQEQHKQVLLKHLINVPYKYIKVKAK